MRPEILAYMHNHFRHLGKWRRFLKSELPICREDRDKLIKLLDILEEAVTIIGEDCS